MKAETKLEILQERLPWLLLQLALTVVPVLVLVLVPVPVPMSVVYRAMVVLTLAPAPCPARRSHGARRPADTRKWHHRPSPRPTTDTTFLCP